MSWPEAVALIGIAACVAAVWITMTICNYLENKETGDE